MLLEGRAQEMLPLQQGTGERKYQGGSFSRNNQFANQRRVLRDGPFYGIYKLLRLDPVTLTRLCEEGGPDS